MLIHLVGHCLHYIIHTIHFDPFCLSYLSFFLDCPFLRGMILLTYNCSVGQPIHGCTTWRYTAQPGHKISGMVHLDRPHHLVPRMNRIGYRHRSQWWEVGCLQALLISSESAKLLRCTRAFRCRCPISLASGNSLARSCLEPDIQYGKYWYEAQRLKEWWVTRSRKWWVEYGWIKSYCSPVAPGTGLFLDHTHSAVQG